MDGLSRALVQAGSRVTVLTTDVLDEQRRSDVPADRDHHGVRVLTVPNWSNRAAYRHQLFTPRGIAAALGRITSPSTWFISTATDISSTMALYGGRVKPAFLT